MREVLLVRPDGNQADADALAAAGLVAVVDPYLEIVPAAPAVGRRATGALRRLTAGDWVGLTSARTLPYWRSLDPAADAELANAGRRGVRFAALGPATAATLPPLVEVPASLSEGAPAIPSSLGDPPSASPSVPGSAPADLVADGSGSLALLTCLLACEPATALLPGSASASPRLHDGLVAAGWRVILAPLYSPRPVRRRPATAHRIRTGDFAAIVLRSPSAVTAVAQHAPVPAHTVALAVGPTTARAARARGWRVTELPTGTPSQVAAAAAATLRSPR